VTTSIIALVVVLVLLAVAIYPKKSTTSQSSSGLPNPWDSSSLRVRQVREEADAIADEFRRKAEEAWRAELRQKASQLLAEPK
jgi:hypothetical protein